MTIDLSAVRAKLGQKLVEHDLATAAPLRGMVVTFDRDETPPEEGQPIAHGWHLAYFPEPSRLSELGEDGLPLARGMLPAMPLPRRMYAGAKLTFHAPILVGDRLMRETEFSDVQLREGSTGTLILATQTRRFYTPRGLALTDEQHTIFREAVPPGAKSGVPKREAPPSDLPWRRMITPDPVSLFRYSALTFNPHRIHYDRPYAMGVEGYPGLVVHGPFSQQCLLDLLRDHVGAEAIADCTMRARAPLFDVAPFTLVGRRGGQMADLWAMTPEGTIAMQVTATLT
ncbi:MAG TPA: MaoC family dehydratase N-terminal domain-containing protein [Acetobacteraceae bacterium]|jgi:3-methylfumaryl-CoA hydratase|nr:MaoC family dehydratase N-terminal domain-containing protein [Acetobacteraceae bacterium]